MGVENPKAKPEEEQSRKIDQSREPASEEEPVRIQMYNGGYYEVSYEEWQTLLTTNGRGGT